MNRTKRSLAALLLLAVGACAQPAPSAEPQALPADPAADSASVSVVLDAFHAAAAAGDFDAYFGLFHPEGVFLGTDATERWTVAQFKEYARPHFGPGGGWTYHPRNRSIDFTPDGNAAFFDELLDNDGLGETRGSGVLVRDVTGWKVAQYNLSIPIPNPLADSVAGMIRAAK